MRVLLSAGRGGYRRICCLGSERMLESHAGNLSVFCIILAVVVGGFGEGIGDRETDLVWRTLASDF